MDEHFAASSAGKKGGNESTPMRSNGPKTSSPGMPSRTLSITPDTSGRKQGVLPKAVAVLVLAFGLFGYNHFPKLQRPSFSSVWPPYPYPLPFSLLSKLLPHPATSCDDASALAFLDLPHTYALCSHSEDGKRVYTVDLNNSVVECVGVSGERVVAVGDIGE